MTVYKRNQVEEAVFRTLKAQGERVNELRLRLKRLLVADRHLGRHPRSKDRAAQHYAFYSDEPAGSGIEVMFSGSEAFAVLAGLLFLEHGFPQAFVVRTMRQVRGQLERAHAQTLPAKDPAVLFNEEAIRARARLGDIATESTEEVFLVLATFPNAPLSASKESSAVAICQGQAEVMDFILRTCPLGTTATTFPLSRLMNAFAENLSRTRAIKRGRAAV